MWRGGRVPPAWRDAAEHTGPGAWAERVLHPRAYGAFPREIRRYVLDQGVIDLGFAIRSMAFLPAQPYRISSRKGAPEGNVTRD
jgi:N-acyl-D-amino-acid deacylase